MIKIIQGTPKASALFYWTDNSYDKKVYYASFFTISPVKMDMADIPIPEETLSLSFPIMIHEPMRCSDIDKVISDARERNAAIVDCGRTTAKSVRARMKKALEEYLHAYITHYIEMDKKEKDMESKKVLSDINLENIKKKIKKNNSKDILEKSSKLFSLIDSFREELKSSSKRKNLEDEELEPYLNKFLSFRTDEFEDFNDFLIAVGRKGKISDKVVELYKRKYGNEKERKSFSPEDNDELKSLLILVKLDVRREIMRKKLKTTDVALTTIEEIFKIKNLKPPFCGDEDLNSFCDILTEPGLVPTNIAKKYIEKYFCVITKKFDEAAKIHNEIKEAEKKYYESKK